MALDRSLIARLPLFQGLTAAELDELLRGARSSRYAKETLIFEQEAEAHSFFVLLDGHIRVVRTTPDGHQVIVRYISEGEIFGVAAALGRTTSGERRRGGGLRRVGVAECALEGIVVAVSDFRRHTFKTVGSRLQETQTRVVEMSTQQVEQRVAHALLRLVNQTGRKTDGGIEIDFPISRQDIAEMTGTTLHTVSRLLSAWEEKGLIASGRQRVTVVDPHRLMLLAENRGKH